MDNSNINHLGSLPASAAAAQTYAAASYNTAMAQATDNGQWRSHAQPKGEWDYPSFFASANVGAYGNGGACEAKSGYPYFGFEVSRVH